MKDRLRQALQDIKDYELYKDVMETAGVIFDCYFILSMH